MTKEELIKLSRENLRKSKQGSLCECYDEAFIKGYELSKNRIEDLEKENAELKNFIMQSKKDGISPINALIIKNLANQLTNAKEIIKKFSEFANLEVEYDPEHPQEHTDLWNDLCKEAEQFINSEVEK